MTRMPRSGHSRRGGRRALAARRYKAGRSGVPEPGRNRRAASAWMVAGIASVETGWSGRKPSAASRVVS